jgi:hypothetical protein
MNSDEEIQSQFSGWKSSVTAGNQAGGNNAAAMQKWLTDLEAKANQRLERFATAIVSQCQNAEQARPFIFPHGRASPEAGEFQFRRAGEPEGPDDGLRQREKDLSVQLKKVKAMTFVLESERRTIRQRIGGNQQGSSE